MSDVFPPVPSAEFFPERPGAKVVVQPEGGRLVYGGVFHRVVCRVLQPGCFSEENQNRWGFTGCERTPGTSASGLRLHYTWADGRPRGADILMIEPEGPFSEGHIREQVRLLEGINGFEGYEAAVRRHNELVAA